MAGNKGIFNLGKGYVKSKNPRAGTANYNGTVLLSTSTDIVDEGGNGIGYITSLTPSESRPTTLIRHLSSDDAGRVIEQAPSPSTITLSVNGFYLYPFGEQAQGSLINRLAQNFGLPNPGAVMDTLEEQKIGFNLRKRIVNPSTGLVLSILEYQDCWLTQHSDPYQIGTPTVAEIASINCSRKVHILVDNATLATVGA